MEHIPAWVPEFDSSRIVYLAVHQVTEMSFPNEWKPGEKTSRLTVLLGYVNLMGRDDQGNWVESSSENCPDGSYDCQGLGCLRSLCGAMASLEANHRRGNAMTMNLPTDHEQLAVDRFRQKPPSPSAVAICGTLCPKKGYRCSVTWFYHSDRLKEVSAGFCCFNGLVL
jgi:hypothetical protein